MKTEKAIFRPSAEHANPRGVCGFFREVIASIAARPRAMRVEVDFSEASPAEAVVLDFEAGEPVFRQCGRHAAHGKFGGCWLAEHDVPLELSRATTAFLLVPDGAGRTRVTSARAAHVPAIAARFLVKFKRVSGRWP